MLDLEEDIARVHDPFEGEMIRDLEIRNGVMVYQIPENYEKILSIFPAPAVTGHSYLVELESEE